MKNIFYWLIGGVLLTAVAFFIPEQSGSMWPSVISSAIVAFLYLGIFLAVWLKEIDSSTKRKAIAVTFTVLFVFSIASAVISYENSVRQQETLTNIRTDIESDLMYTYINRSLVKTLGRVHSEEERSDDLGALFTAEYDSLITEDSLFNYGPEREDKTLYLYVARATSDSVVLIGESNYIDGTSSEFQNFSGNNGRYQARGILTAKGVDYERQN